jgi:hypothetical protein
MLVNECEELVSEFFEIDFLGQRGDLWYDDDHSLAMFDRQIPRLKIRLGRERGH